MSEFKPLADAVHEARSHKKMSLSLLSACAGLSSGYISETERGIRLPVEPTDKLLKLCDALSISREQLAYCLVYNHALRTVGKDLSFAWHKVYGDKFPKFMRSFMQYLVTIQVMAAVSYEDETKFDAIRLYCAATPRFVFLGANSWWELPLLDDSIRFAWGDDSAVMAYARQYKLWIPFNTSSV